MHSVSSVDTFDIIALKQSILSFYVIFAIMWNKNTANTVIFSAYAEYFTGWVKWQ